MESGWVMGGVAKGIHPNMCVVLAELCEQREKTWHVKCCWDVKYICAMNVCVCARRMCISARYAEKTVCVLEKRTTGSSLNLYTKINQDV